MTARAIPPRCRRSNSNGGSSSSSDGGDTPPRSICRGTGRARSRARLRGGARRPNAAAAAAAATRRIPGPKIEYAKKEVVAVGGGGGADVVYFFVARADAAASWAATCGRGIAAAAQRLTVHGCLAAVGTRSQFFCFCYFCCLRVAPHPHVPP